MALSTASRQHAASPLRSEPAADARGMARPPDGAQPGPGARGRWPGDPSPRSIRRARIILAVGAVVLALAVVPLVAGNAPVAGAIALAGVLLIWLALWRRSRLIPPMHAARKRREALLQAFAAARVPVPASVLNEPWREQAPALATPEEDAHLAAVQTRGEREAPQVAATVRDLVARLGSDQPTARQAAYEAAAVRCDARRAKLEGWLLGDAGVVRATTDDHAASAVALAGSLDVLLHAGRADLAADRHDTPALRQLLAFDAAFGSPAGADDQVALTLCAEACRLLEVPIAPDRQAYADVFAREQRQDPVTLDLADDDVDRLVRVLADGARERAATTESGWWRYPTFTQHLGAEIGTWDSRQPRVRATLGAAARRHLGALLEARIAYRDRLLAGGEPLLVSLRGELAEARARDQALLARIRPAPAE